MNKFSALSSCISHRDEFGEHRKSVSSQVDATARPLTCAPCRVLGARPQENKSISEINKNQRIIKSFHLTFFKIWKLIHNLLLSRIIFQIQNSRFLYVNHHLFSYTYFLAWPGKYLMYLLSWRDKYLIVSAQKRNSAYKIIQYNENRNENEIGA